MADDRKSNQGGKKQESRQQGGHEGGGKSGDKQAGSQQGDKGTSKAAAGKANARLKRNGNGEPTLMSRLAFPYLCLIAHAIITGASTDRFSE